MKNSSIRRPIFLGLIASAALMLFTWPMFISAQLQSETQFAQLAFIILMPMILMLAFSEFTSGNIDSRQLAMLGVLTAVNAFIRMFGAGAAGIETSFFLIIISAYVFGSGFGFVMGASSLLVSALITGGIGPWLPFQMMAAGLIGLGAGALPKSSSKWLQVFTMVIYAAIAAFIYGALMTIWNWPFLAGVGSDVSYQPGAGALENIARFMKFEIFTGGLLWDAGRAITTCTLIALTAPALLATLRRAANRAGVKKF